MRLLCRASNIRLDLVVRELVLSVSGVLCVALLALVIRGGLPLFGQLAADVVGGGAGRGLRVVTLVLVVSGCCACSGLDDCNCLA